MSELSKIWDLYKKHLSRSKDYSGALLVILALITIPFGIAAAFYEKSTFSSSNLLYKISLPILLTFYLLSRRWQKRSSYAHRGASAEDKVDQLFQDNLPPGWTKERNVELKKGGDIDFLIVSPNNKIIIVDAKSRSLPIYQKSPIMFEMTKGLRKQAARLKEDRNITGWIVCILCLVDQKTDKKPYEFENTWIADFDNIIPLLHDLSKSNF